MKRAMLTDLVTGEKLDLTALVEEHEEVTVGREGNGNIIGLADPRVSRSHATIVYDWKELGENFYIKDHGSTNGTLIDDYELPSMEWAVLTHGDQLRFGRENGYGFLFEVQEINPKSPSQ